jgi:L-histidine N-alpha-methyltransferase
MTALVRGEATIVAARESLAADVRHFLQATPRQLPSRALYDTLGSALFDAICELPWYPVTRAERRLIVAHRAAIADCAWQPERLVELGCGNGEKLSLLLGPRDAASHRALRRIDLVDVSASALSAAARLIAENRDLSIVTHQHRYEDGLAIAAGSRIGTERFGVLFFGSNIGNFDPAGATAFLETMRKTLRDDDTLVIGADLVKTERDLLRAYDDPLGVTAAFNKNLLVRINRDMGANFDITAFDHRAVWNAEQSRIEMHLVSRGKQRVDIPAAGMSLELRAGEMIWTESSYKYDVKAFEALLRRTGFVPVRHWNDREGQFLLVVARAA